MRLIRKINSYREMHGVGRTIKKSLSVPYYWAARQLQLPYVRSLYGVRMRANFADKTFQSCLRAWYGFRFADFLHDFSRPFYFLDVGANQGLYSLVAAQNSYCKHVWAFEPVHSTHSILTLNVRANGMEHIIEAVRAAISADDRDRTISLARLHSGGATLEAAHDTKGHSENVQCMSGLTVDRLISVTDPSIEVLMKLDTEGHELVVINQLRATRIWKCVSHLFTEVNPAWIDQNALTELLRDEGFIEAFRTSSGRHHDVMWQRFP